MDAWVAIGAAGVAGGIAGVAMGWLLADRKAQAAAAAAETARALSQQRAAGLEQELRQTTANYEKRLNDAAEASRVQTESVETLRGQLGTAQQQNATVAAQLQASQQNIEEQKKLLDEADTKLTAAFAAASREALERASGTFMEMAKTRFETLSTEAAGALDQRKAQIATLLKPLEEMMGTYQKRIGEIESTRTNTYGELLKQLGGMSETQRLLSVQTTQLATALKKSTVRGRWGEISLARLAELSGMTRGVDYELQESVTTDEGARLRPDMVVKMPGDRLAIIDSKAVIDAFLNAAAATDEVTRADAMKAHVRNVRARIDDLSSKAYWSQFTNTPEFVVLFLPGESFLYAACEQDPTLIEDALARKVLLATPTTLVGLLRTIEYCWRQQALGENAEEIRKLGIEIYDRLAVLGANMARVGKSLDSAVESYNSVVSSLETRLLVSARKMSELGAHSDRELPELESVDRKARDVEANFKADRLFPD